MATRHEQHLGETRDDLVSQVGMESHELPLEEFPPLSSAFYLTED